jgi:L-lysine 2,3-aminomutase
VISGGKTYETKRKSLHDILEELEQSEGVAGLKRLHRELCVATPDLFARLDQYDLYLLYDFNFDAKRAQYFSQFSI